jgi:hypothetical protein
LAGTIFYIIGISLSYQVEIIQAKNKPWQFMATERGQVFTANEPVWHYTVELTTQFLENQLKKDETFFALPYDPLYYYLTGKPSPTRQLIFFEHIKIPPEQEIKIIQELEKNKVNYVVLSSRYNSPEPGLGILGKTYCPLIGRYLNENFKKIAAFGDWTHPGEWAWNHGTKILRRK